MRQVYVAQNALDAHFVRTLLEEHGIEAIVQNEMLGQARGELPVDASTVSVVCVVDDARAEEAERIVEGIAKKHVGADWTCSSCGERNGPAFEVCWSCGNPH